MNLKAVAQGIIDFRDAKDKIDGLTQDPINPNRADDGRGIEHAFWMLNEIIQGKVEGEKGHRWLGYAQGILVHEDELTLEEAKLLNKTDGAYRP